MSGDCQECSEKRLSVQRKVSQPGDQLELEADRMADRMADRIMGSLQQPALSAGPISSAQADSSIPRSILDSSVISRQIATPERAEPSASVRAAPAQRTPPTAATATATPRPASAGLIVEDDAREVAPRQMRKSQFLDELKSSVCAAADAELAAVGRSAQGCPYVENWINHYRSKDSRHVERALHKYAPEAAGIASARDYIPIVSNRIRRSVSVWARTGQITGVPEELAGQIPGGGLLGTIGGLASGIGSAVGGLVSSIGSAVSGVASGIGHALSSIGSLFRKARDGAATEADPEQIRSQLGHGQPLDGGVKSRMESAFGHDFSQVRVHNDTGAGELSASLNAKAFTLGEHVAFGSGEYRPGSIIGDALIAHELAHVVQQGGQHEPDRPMQKGEEESSGLEEDADMSAIAAVTSIWSGAKGLFPGKGPKAMPRAKGGLGLRRCGGATAATRPTASQPNCPTGTAIDHMVDMTPTALAQGYRTGYGAMAVMRVLPDDVTWDGSQVPEVVTLHSSTCPPSWNLCTGGDTFPVGSGKHSSVLGDLPPQRNRFYDFHTSRWARGSRLHDASQNPGGLDSCEVQCDQQYMCGGHVIGNYRVTHAFAKGSFHGRDVTVVTATKIPTSP